VAYRLPGQVATDATAVTVDGIGHYVRSSAVTFDVG
jgi:hypothetical protein